MRRWRVPGVPRRWWTGAVTETSAGAGAPARISAIRWPLLLVLASLAALAPVATDLYLPGFPELGADFGAEASAVQLTLTSFLVGLAFGQLVMGPLSDRRGRRGPLIVSASVCVAAGVVCALAPTLPVLVLARLVQGFAGAGGMVIGRAIIADVVTGRAAARAFTLMITVGGVAPVLAPLVGGLLADPIGWRGMLWTVAVLCAAMLVGVLLVIPETHPAEARRHGRRRPRWTASGPSCAPARYRAPVGRVRASLRRDDGLHLVLAVRLPERRRARRGRLRPRVRRERRRADRPRAGWPATSSTGGRHAAWCARPSRSSSPATVTFLVLALADVPAWLLPVPIFVAVASNGAIMGNSAALAMAEVRPVAGTGSAVLGFAQFGLGALVAPLVGLGGESSAVVPALVMTVASACGFLASRRLHPVELRPVMSRVAPRMLRVRLVTTRVRHEAQLNESRGATQRITRRNSTDGGVLDGDGDVVEEAAQPDDGGLGVAARVPVGGLGDLHRLERGVGDHEVEDGEAAVGEAGRDERAHLGAADRERQREQGGDLHQDRAVDDPEPLHLHLERTLALAGGAELGHRVRHLLQAAPASARRRRAAGCRAPPRRRGGR